MLLRDDEVCTVAQYKFVCRPVITTSRSKHIVCCIYGLLQGGVNSLLRNNVRSCCVTDSELERSGRKLSWSDFEAVCLGGPQNNFNKHSQSRRWHLNRRSPRCEAGVLATWHDVSAQTEVKPDSSTFHYVWESWVCCSRGKAVPLQAWSGPEGSRKLKFPDFMTTAQDGGKVVSLTHRPPLPPGKSSWYSFLLEAESTPGP